MFHMYLKLVKIITIVQMLGLYLDTLIFGQESCVMFSILNKITIKKELQIFLTNNVLLD